MRDRKAGGPVRRGVPADRGSATVWLVALGLLSVAVFTACLTLGAVVAARHRAESAADLAALAAADRLLLDPDGGCGRAAELTRVQDRVELVSCTPLLGQDAVEVVVRAPVRGLPVPLGPATARSRAGPLWAWGEDADVPPVEPSVPAAARVGGSAGAGAGGFGEQDVE